MNTPGDDNETELLLNAYVDGELDAASALTFDKRLAGDPQLAAARDRLLALRSLLRDNVPRETASPSMRRAMATQAGSRSGADLFADQASSWRDLFSLRSSARMWNLPLAACLAGALFGAALTFGLTTRPPGPAVAEVVADHLRAVMAPQPFDVASSDQHTVKPWFTGRLSFAPNVFDLTQAGFLLVGGRVDVVGGEPAATLVFRHGKHLVSLISQPSRAGSPSSNGGATDRGFGVREWQMGGMRYWAVSDVAPEELDAFEAAARAQLSRAD